MASLIGIGISLGMKGVAEGVETEDHAYLACEMGCDYLQGYFFGKPMSADALLARLQANHGRFWSNAPGFGKGEQAARVG